MSLRLLHTSDWHLGHCLNDLGREHEHRAFLAWLLDTLAAERIDALLVTGDVFDASNPPASAETMWFEFLAAVRARLPALDVVVIGGNHDSAARLEAPRALLDGLGIRVVGGLPRAAEGGLDLDRLLIPLRDASGAPAALVAAVPFLRPADLDVRLDDAGAAEPLADPLIAGVRRLYAEVLDAARARRAAGQALLATGHLYMVGTALSQLSERRILGGNQHALPPDLFPEDLAYVALGHLHRAQRVGREQVRYAGSPLPLALDEASYRHSVAIVELDGEAPAAVRTVPVPRAVDIVRLPASGAATIDELEPMLAALDAARPDDPARPYLEVHVALPAPVPELRRRLEAALAGRRPRLVRIVAVYPGDGRALAEAVAAPELKDVDPEEVLARKWRRDHGGEPPAALVQMFHELVEEVRRADPAPGPRGDGGGPARVERARAKEASA